MKYRLKDKNVYMDNVYVRECEKKTDYTKIDNIEDQPEGYNSNIKHIQIAENLYKKVDLSKNN